MSQPSQAEENDLKATVEGLRRHIRLLEDIIDDFKHTLDRAEQERQDHHADLKAKIEAMEGYRDEQIARAIAQHEIEVLTERLNAAQRRQSVLCSPGNWL
jgi:chromosome segregation ATPase